MKSINEAALESDLLYRFQYITEFMGFGEADIAAILGAKPLLAPLVPGLVDAVYDKLFSYSATWRHFVPVQSGYTGTSPKGVEDLTPDHPMIKFRKEKLSRYLARLVTGPYDSNMVTYLDFVGKIHTDRAGSPQIIVPLIQMNALMGFVSDALTATILSFNLPPATANTTLRAFNKLLWIQNDLITRHYQK